MKQTEKDQEAGNLPGRKQSLMPPKIMPTILSAGI